MAGHGLGKRFRYGGSNRLPWGRGKEVTGNNGEYVATSETFVSRFIELQDRSASKFINSYLPRLILRVSRIYLFCCDQGRSTECAHDDDKPSLG